MGNLEDLERLASLKERGVLTQEEYDREKTKLLQQESTKPVGAFISRRNVTVVSLLVVLCSMAGIVEWRAATGKSENQVAAPSTQTSLSTNNQQQQSYEPLMASAYFFSKFVDYRKRGLAARAKSDLRNAAVAQEAYFVDYEEYIDCSNQECEQKLPGYIRSKGVNLEMKLKGTGFVATAWHEGNPNEKFYWDSEQGGLQDTAHASNLPASNATSPSGSLNPFGNSNYSAIAKSNLRNAATSEEAYFVDEEDYYDCADKQCEKLPGLRLSDGVRIQLKVIDQLKYPSFIGKAWHEKDPSKIYYWDSSDGGLTDRSVEIEKKLAMAKIE